MSDSKINTNKSVLTTTEVAELLEISEATVWDWAARKIIPSHKIGSKCRFNRREIMALVGGDESLDNANDPITTWLIDQLNKRRQELAVTGTARTTAALND